jgi:peptidoglycan/xylan/chitin deacetylase (PgdA/CDA1 family)
MRAKYLPIFIILIIHFFVPGTSYAQDYGDISVKTWPDDRQSAFSFTFDDGCMTQYTYAAPILDTFKFKGTFFVISGTLTDNLPAIDRNGTWNQFRLLSLEGHEIGSHTVTHPDLTTLPVGDTSVPGTLLYELFQSKKTINEKIPNQKCTVLSYPDLAYDSSVYTNSSLFYEAARSGGGSPVDAALGGQEFYRTVAYEELFNVPRNSTLDDLDELTDFENYVDRSIGMGKWGMIEIHEVVPFTQIPQLVVNGEWYPMSTEWLTSLCQRLKQKSDSNLVWVETMGNVSRYEHERQVFQWDVLTETASQMQIHAYDTLNDDIYNYPLTVDISIPPDWEKVIVNQGIKTDTVHSFTADSINFYVRANIVPDGGIITLDKMPLKLILSALIEGMYKDSTMVPDTIMVELHNLISPYEMADTCTGLLDSAGKGLFTFTKAVNNTPYFLVVKHRNALETWSSGVQSFNSFAMSYDFTDSQSKAFGNNLILKRGRYCIYSGDVNQDGVVDSLDLVAIDFDNSNYVRGYAITDLNGDGIVDLRDMILAECNSMKYVTRIIPCESTTIKKAKKVPHKMVKN